MYAAPEVLMGQPSNEKVRRRDWASDQGLGSGSRSSPGMKHVRWQGSAFDAVHFSLGLTLRRVAPTTSLFVTACKAQLLCLASSICLLPAAPHMPRRVALRTGCERPSHFEPHSTHRVALPICCELMCHFKPAARDARPPFQCLCPNTPSLSVNPRHGRRTPSATGWSCGS